MSGLRGLRGNAKSSSSPSAGSSPFVTSELSPSMTASREARPGSMLLLGGVRVWKADFGSVAVTELLDLLAILGSVLELT